MKAPALLLPLLLALPAAAEPRTYELDPDFSSVHFEVLHFGTSTLRGRIGPVRGEVEIDAAAGRGRVGLVIDMRTLDTGFKPLDARLRQPDLLDIGAHPEAWFVAERFHFEQGRPVALTGEFTLRGTSAPLTLRALRFACIEVPGAGTRCGGDFEGEVSRSHFGASFGVPLVADRVRLLVQVEGVRRR